MGSPRPPSGSVTKGGLGGEFFLKVDLSGSGPRGPRIRSRNYDRGSPRNYWSAIWEDHFLGDRPTTGAERKRKWREREREKRKLELPFDPTDGMAALMARALPILTPDPKY
jgi:hypothetical protein